MCVFIGGEGLSQPSLNSRFPWHWPQTATHTHARTHTHTHTILTPLDPTVAMRAAGLRRLVWGSLQERTQQYSTGPGDPSEEQSVHNTYLKINGRNIISKQLLNVWSLTNSELNKYSNNSHKPAVCQSAEARGVSIRPEVTGFSSKEIVSMDIK